MKKYIGYIGVVIAIIGIVSASLIIAVATPILYEMSNNVVFISDEPLRSETGAIKGDGTGRNADNPLISQNYGSEYSYLNTALYQATEKLKDSGGTIVVMGRCCFDYLDVCTAKFGEKTIVFTSVYGGGDYRKTNDARIVLDGSSSISVYGSSVWENITFETATEDRVISFNGFETKIENGVECRVIDNEKANKSEYYLSLCAGSLTENSYGQAPFLSIKSGTYHKIVAGLWGENVEQVADDMHTTLYLGGSVRVLGLISGTAYGKCDFGGSVNIIIDGGVYEGDIIGAFGSGMTNPDSLVVIKINDGDFSKTLSIRNCGVGCKNDSPQYSVLDFSDWKGGLSDLAYAYNSITFFREVLLPVNITDDDLRDFDHKPPIETEGTTEQTEDYDVTNEMSDSESEKNDEDIEKQEDHSVLFMVISVLMLVCIIIVVLYSKKRKNIC